MATSSPPPSKMPSGPYFLPHPAYADDQPYSRTILTTHVIYRGLQAGTLVGTLVGTTRLALQHGRAALTARALLQAAGRGALTGGVLLAAAVPARMWGRTAIEWQDRAWRLLENRGQVSVDRWSGAGAVVAGAVGWRTAAATVLPGRAKALVVLGAAGWGSLVGSVGSMGFRMGTGTF